MYGKRVKIANIMNSINACTGMSFQKKVVELLEILCEQKNLRFEKVEPTNGDAKNDGWIEEKNIYFAMFSPSDANISQNNQIVKKLNDDLSGLCDQVFNRNRWGRDINEFYLIVNTHDKSLPADPDRLRTKKIEEIKGIFNKEFKAEIISANDIKRYLLDLTDEVINKISENLDVETIIGEFSVVDVLSFVDEYTQYLVSNNIEQEDIDYLKIPTENKIEINQLTNKKEHILSLIGASDKIDKYVSFVLNEGKDLEKYNRLKNYIINKYRELSYNYIGEELYEKLLDCLINDNMMSSHIHILEAFVVNIFVRCDIFEKEIKS